MQLRLERNILHMYTAGTSTSDSSGGGEEEGDGGMCVPRTCDTNYDFILTFLGKWGHFGWSEVCLRVKTR